MLSGEEYAVYANQQFRQAAGWKCTGVPVSYVQLRTIPQYNTHMLTFFFFFALNLYPIRNEDTLNQDNQFIHVAYFLIIVSVIYS